MTLKKFGKRGNEITLLQCGFADEWIAGIYYVPQRRPLRSNISAESPDWLATLLSKPFSETRRETVAQLFLWQFS